jgi:hypothetical protein
LDFQPFSVTCVTCGSRLRVGRQELIGSIVACPKCQAMVQLTRQSTDPTGGSPIALGSKPVDSGALTEDSISQPALPTAQTERSPQSGFSEPPPVFSVDAPSLTPTSDAAPDQGPTPPPNWHSQKTAQSRRIALAVVVALASLVSVALLLSVFLRSRSDVVKTETAVDAPPQIPPAASDSAAQNDPPLSSTAVPPDSSDPDQDLAAETIQSPAEVPPPGPLTDADQPDANPGADADTSADPPARVPDPNVASTDAALRSGLLPANPLLPDNPLEGMLPGNPLEGMLPPGGSPLGGPPTPSDELSTLTELPAGLKDLLVGLDVDRPQFTATQPAPSTIDEIQLDRAADAEVNLENAVQQAAPFNMKQRLGLSVALQAADPAGYPLNDLMLVLSQFSGVPIDLHWVSFEIVGMPIDQLIKLPSSWLTIEEILEAVCEANEATFEINARSITVRPTDDRFLQAVEHLLDLSDIQPDSDSAVATARQLLGQTDGDSSRVSIPAEVGPKQAAVLVCETIRRIRGVAGKLPDPVLARWSGPYRDQITAWNRLEGGVSGPRQLQPIAFVSIIRQIAKRNGATCFINWQDGSRRDLWPSEKVMPKTGQGVSAADALEQLLTPEKLHVRVVDSGHWWIGSEASYDRFPVAIWFAKAEEETDPHEMKTRMEAILSGAAVDGSQVGAVAVDPASEICLAVLPRYLLRQLPRLLQQFP